MKYSNKYYENIRDWLKLNRSVDKENFAWVLDRWFTEYQKGVLYLRFEKGFNITDIAKEYDKAVVSIFKLLQRMEYTLGRLQVFFTGDLPEVEREDYLAYYFKDVFSDKDLSVLQGLGFNKLTDFSRGKLHTIKDSLSDKNYLKLRALLQDKGVYQGETARIFLDYPDNIIDALGMSKEYVVIDKLEEVINSMDGTKYSDAYKVGMARCQKYLTLEDIAKGMLGGVTREAVRQKYEIFLDYIRCRRCLFDLRFERGDINLLDEDLGSKYTAHLGRPLVNKIKSLDFRTLRDVLVCSPEDLMACRGLGEAKVNNLVSKLYDLGFSLGSVESDLGLTLDGVCFRIFKALTVALKCKDFELLGYVKLGRLQFEFKDSEMWVYYKDGDNEHYKLWYSQKLCKILSCEVTKGDITQKVVSEGYLVKVLDNVILKLVSKVKSNSVTGENNVYFLVR